MQYATVEVSERWLNGVLDLLGRISKDTDKVVQPSKIELEARSLLIQYNNMVK